MAAATRTTTIAGSRGDVILADVSNFSGAKERIPPRLSGTYRV
jgi:hypothetical protein